jgi:predicted alpha/beta superfamily hydrolase
LKGAEIMKKIILALSLSLILIFISQVFCVVYAQDHPVISDSIYSGVLKEQRSIKIQLPEAYKPGSTDKYEVIYVTDGEWAMHPFSFIYKWAQDENYVPPAILVAIPNTYINKANQRDRDFLPVHVPEPAISGGADNFLSFIKNELIPYINNKYPANGTSSIYGHSYGGLFVLYALLTEPQLFESYYATDPPFSWNNDYLIRMAAEKLDNLPADKIFWIAGTSQNQTIGRLDSLLRLHAPKKLHWNMATYPNERHNSVRLKAMYDGIKFSYSGYSNAPLVFHPMNGILLKDKPMWICLQDIYPEQRYTVDGTEPERTSTKVDRCITITGPAQLVMKSFSTSGKYDKTARGNFELGEPLSSVPKPNRINSGGLKYSYYEGSWEKLPDFKELRPVKTGVADSVFNIKQLPAKTNFACLFQGYFEIVKDGYYVFALVSNDGSKLFLGDKLIIDNDGVRPTASVKSFVLPLEKGFYPVRIEYFQKNESSVFLLFYIAPETGDINSNAIPFPFKYQYYGD